MKVVQDDGISGFGARFSDRKEGAKLLDKVRRGDVLVVRWVDRLGRNHEDVTEAIRALMAKGVIIKTPINATTLMLLRLAHLKGRQGCPHRVRGRNRPSPGRSDQRGAESWHQEGQGGGVRSNIGVASRPSTALSFC